MAVRRIVPKKLDKASLPTEYETFTNAYFHEALKYRLWIGPTQPPIDKSTTGDIWRQDNVNPHVFRQFMPNNTWVNMLAGTIYGGQAQSGFVTPENGALLSGASVNTTEDSLVLRGPEGGSEFGAITISDILRPETAKLSSIFTNSTTTKKNAIYFRADAGTPTPSNDQGFIIHESSSETGDHDKGVLHLVPSDNNSGDDHVAIGASPSGVSNYTAKLRLYTSGNVKSLGQIEAVSFNSTSTIEAKENIYPTTISAVDLINQTKIVDFNFKGFDEPKIGFIAEHTNTLLSGPEQKIMDHSNAIGLLLKAVQELSAEVEELKSRLGE